MQKVYILTQGEYSEYHIVSVFSSRENAELARARFDLSDVDIEEWPLDQGIKHLRAGLFLWLVNIHKDGTILGLWRNTQGKEPFFYFPKQNFVFTVWARNKAHAVKIAGEKRTRILAGELPCEGYALSGRKEEGGK